jgi:hypothetical protein
MKKLAFLTCVVLLAACGAKKETAETELKEWKEMDAYHLIMAEAFHPYKDSGNLVPARNLIKDLTDEANKWAAAPLPENVNTDETKALIKSLIEDAGVMNTQNTEGVADSVFAQTLVRLHNNFHKIQEQWHGGGKKEGHEHH